MNHIKICYYRKKDWKRLLEISDDRDTLHSTWDEWNNAFNSATLDLENKGFVIKKAVVDLNKLIEFCKENQLKNTGATRSQFIQQS
jgi:hypothetical protein